MNDTPTTPASGSEALRVEAQRCSSLAKQAQETLARLEQQLTSCDDSIAEHRAALVSHKQQLTADKSHRDELSETLTRQRKRAAQAAKQAAKADAKYDKAVLAQLVLDAKEAAATKASATVKRTAAAKTSRTTTANQQATTPNAPTAPTARRTRKTTTS